MKTFEELGVSEEIRRAITELGFEHPMPVQEEVIPYLLGNKNDVVALAQTGTGKTAAYGIPVLQKLDPNDRQTQGIEEFNDFVAHDERVERVMLPLRDGLTLIYKR